MAPILIDAILLIYLYDQNHPVPQSCVIVAFDQLELTGFGRLGVQNLAEFISVNTRLLSPPLNTSEALEQMNLFLRAWPVFDLTPLSVLETARGVRDYQMSYYDAQI